LTERRRRRGERTVTARDAKRITLDELARDVAGVLDRVVRDRETVVVERGGSDVAVIRPTATKGGRRGRRPRTPADRAAFLATAGAWDGLVDTERLKADVAERVFRQFLRGVDVLPLTRPIMRRFARLRGGLRRRGQLIGDPDAPIAATALHHGLALVTGNRAHFRRIPDLRLYPAG
jgi:predicted nucleic acid-binding protein